MEPRAFYRLQGPTEWGHAPNTYSYSSLKSIQECPRRWQLIHGTYGELRGCPRRYDKAAFEGSVVHDMLDKLFRAMALKGLPPKGSADFRQAVAGVGLMDGIRAAVAEHQERQTASPRSTGARYTSNPRQLYNQVTRQFHALYDELATDLASEFTAQAPVPEDAEGPALLDAVRSLGVLTEVRLRHPTLDLGGIVDFVTARDGETTVGDFKTGAERPEHQRQVEIYGLLWHRQTGDIPAQLHVRYPRGVVEHEVSRERLDALEEKLAEEIAAATASLATVPGPAKQGEHCAFCPVRQYCDPYWAGHPAPDVESRWSDVELTVVEAQSDNALLARTAAGQQLPVVFDDEVRVLHGPFGVGETLRVLGATWAEKEANVLRLTPGSEVFRRG